MDEVEIRTLNDFGDHDSETDFESENIEECLRASGFIKEEIEYGNVTEFNNTYSEDDASESGTYSDSGSLSKQPSRSGGFSWNSNTTLLLLREYKLRLDKFRNPKYRKSDLWNEIADVFHSYGFEIHHALLDKKFRNMKNTFVNIFFSNLDKRNSRPSKWDYYYTFLDLFKDEEPFKVPVSCEVLNNDGIPVEYGIPVELLTDNDLNLVAQQTTSKSNSTEQKPLNFSWTQDKCMLLLNEYKARLDHFRDPKQQKKALWSEIKDVFQTSGYNVNEEILYKKFRNMKQTYVSNLNSDKKSKWLYQTIFNEILGNVPLANVEYSSLEYETETNLVPEVNESMLKETSGCSNDPRDKSQTSKSYQSSMLEIQRKRLKLDVERTTELKKLRATLEESNRLQERRNDLLEELIHMFRQKTDQGELEI